MCDGEKVIASSHGERLSDPRIDPVIAVCMVHRDERYHKVGDADHHVLYYVPGSDLQANDLGHDVRIFTSEVNALEALARDIGRIDPDIIAGFETQLASIGYLLDRAEHLGHSFGRAISRVRESDDRSKASHRHAAVHTTDGADENAGAKYYRRKGADIKVPGRHVLNLWRVVRKEVKLASYSLHGVAQEVLRVTVAAHPNFVLERWLRSGRRALRALTHLSHKTITCMAILDELDILRRTGELARVYGIDFMSVLTRGSQYRVESMLSRIAHTRGFALLSAQRDQVFNQPAVECLPLVMEPESDFYVDPVIVLDFQSLYPSMVIAHNLCFSTMLGNVNRVEKLHDRQRLGVVDDYTIPATEDIERCTGLRAEDGVFVAPNGDMFLAASARRGVLPQMLEEILQTRIMVKRAMKSISVEDDRDLWKLLNARQFGLKMIANVTYGYASASFSGRMPCAGLADSIVQCGRDALEKMVHFIDGELRDKTGATVVYGDTDSLFVKVPGATRAEAFSIGEEIVQQAQAMFPTPVSLQLEKVYHPCVLLTKKRYVGYAYEHPNASTPTFDAKGIETVRRDSCAIVQRTMERALRMLFELRDVSLVRQMVQRVWQRIISNRVPLSEFTFRKEVKLGSYKDVLPPAAVVATRAMEKDPRAAPRHGERVPFVVVFGGVGAALKDCVVSPSDMFKAEKEGTGRLHSTYYITKQIVPSLDRVFSLLGVNVAAWYAEMPRAYFEPLRNVSAKRIEVYFPTAKPCLLCRGQCSRHLVCDRCVATSSSRQAARYTLEMRQAIIAARRAELERTCLRCVGEFERDTRHIECTNTDCPTLYDRHRLDVRESTGRAVLDDWRLWEDPSHPS